MGTDELPPKNHQPRRRFRDVLRPRLIRSLDDHLEGLAGPLWISAPHGCGKTTALAAWTARLERPVAWWTFDAADDDPVCAVRALVEALQGIRPGCGVAVRDALRLDRPPPYEAFVDQLQAELAAAEEPAVLILDDVDALATPAAAAVLRRFAAGPLGGLQLVLSGAPGEAPPEGAPPPLDQNTLKFDDAETREFFTQTVDVDLEPGAVEVLRDHAAGCIVPLKLATHALVLARDRDRFLAFLAGSATFHEVVVKLLRRLPPPVREFLQRTSVLTRLRADLCDVVTGHDDGREMILRLDRLDLFIESLDADHRWFRLHPELCSSLQEHLASEDPTVAGELHLRASRWYEQRGLRLEATLHARAAGDAPRIAEALAQLAPELMQRGGWDTLQRWIGELPDGLAATQPAVLSVAAWAQLRAGNNRQAEARIEDLLQSVGRDDRSPLALDLHGQGCVIQAVAALDRGEPSIAAELAERGTALLAEDDLRVRRRIPAILGAAQRDEGDLAGAEQGFLEVERVGRYLDDVWDTVQGLCLQAELRIIQGELRGADVLYDHAAAVTERHRARRFGPAASIDVGIAELRWHRNHLADAREHAEAAFEILAEWSAPDLRARAWAMRVRILRSLGSLADAAEAAAAAAADERRGATPWTRSLLAVERARVWIAAGDLDAAEAWATGRSRRELDAAPIRELGGLVVARLLLARDRSDEALALLARLEQDAAAGHRRGRVIEIRALQALGRFAQGSHEKALSRLGRALRRAMRERMVRLFLDEGSAMTALLRHGVERNIWVRPEIQPFAQALLAACEAADEA